MDNITSIINSCYYIYENDLDAVFLLYLEY